MEECLCDSRSKICSFCGKTELWKKSFTFTEL